MAGPSTVQLLEAKDRLVVANAVNEPPAASDLRAARNQSRLAVPPLDHERLERAAHQELADERVERGVAHRPRLGGEL